MVRKLPIELIEKILLYTDSTIILYFHSLNQGIISNYNIKPYLTQECFQKQFELGNVKICDIILKYSIPNSVEIRRIDLEKTISEKSLRYYFDILKDVNFTDFSHPIISNNRALFHADIYWHIIKYQKVSEDFINTYFGEKIYDYIPKLYENQNFSLEFITKLNKKRIDEYNREAFGTMDYGCDESLEYDNLEYKPQKIYNFLTPF
jgi:hypothetical protein